MEENVCWWMIRARTVIMQRSLQRSCTAILWTNLPLPSGQLTGVEIIILQNLSSNNCRMKPMPCPSGLCVALGLEERLLLWDATSVIEAMRRRCVWLIRRPRSTMITIIHAIVACVCKGDQDLKELDAHR